jgi:hypothetical protein
MLCIGLFGTCDKNRWRDPFMAKYDELGISYFNPMVDDWNPGMVPLEAQHLAEDEVIFFPILGWSYAEGSLSELGFGPLKAMRQNRNRSFVYLIETDLHERLTDPERCKSSLRARKLLLGHLKEIDAPNIYVVKTLDEALATTIELYKVHQNLRQLHEAADASMAG